MRDFFNLLGLPFNAAASEVRRACARRVSPVHPDFRAAVHAQKDEGRATKSVVRTPFDVSDVALDFVMMSAVVDRMQSRFFANAE